MEQPVLLAVSGGVDSVVLCHVCHKAGILFTIAHCNFGLRGDESTRDEAFVRRLAEHFRVTVLVKNFDTETYAQQERLSIQEAARNLRYDWFRTLLPYTGAGRVLLAHHANDNIETVLMNYFRGTGIEGMTGIKELSPDKFFARPLLHCTRADIEAYAKEEGLEWVEDSSNASNKYTRNFFRNEVLPMIRNAYPEAEQNLLNNITRFQQISSVYQAAVDQFKRSLCEIKGEETWIPVRKLQKMWQPAVVYELIRSFGFNEKQVPVVEQLLSSSSGKFISNDRWQIIRYRNWLVIAPRSAEAVTITIGKDQPVTHYRHGKIKWEIKEGDTTAITNDPRKALLDAASVEFPLLLRPWKEGDYFYPLGMRKKKKVARFLIDARLPKNAKESVWVLESNRRIIWVVGLRIDDRFKVTNATRSLIEITWDNEAVDA